MKSMTSSSVPFTKMKLGTNKVTQALDIPYKAATDSMFMGPAAPLTFFGSLASRAYGPGLTKLGKAKEKARLETRKTMLGALTKSGDKNSQFNVDKYIDYDRQFEKSFLDPMKGILVTIGCDYERKSTIMDFFS